MTFSQVDTDRDSPANGHAEWADGTPMPDEHISNGQPLDPAAAEEAEAQAVARTLRITERAHQINAERKVDADPKAAAATQGVRLCDVARVMETYRVDKIMLADSMTLLWAMSKAGKTTLLVNLLHALTVPGARFLGAFEVEPLEPDETVALFNFEMSGGMMRGWCEDGGVDMRRVHTYNLRGMPNPFASRATRGRLIKDLRANHSRIAAVDTFSRARTGDNEDSNTQAQDWMLMLQALCMDAGVTESLVLHHSGWNAERMRGASSLHNFPDAIWGLTVDAATDVRSLQVNGRMDEHIKPTGLAYDPRTRLLSWTGEATATVQDAKEAKANEKQASRGRQEERFAQQVLDLLPLQGTRPGVTGLALRTELAERDGMKTPWKHAKFMTAIDRLGALVDTDLGEKNATVYWRKV